MSSEQEEEHRNFIEAKIIIQEIHDDPTVFVVGTAPFGKLWFDHDKIDTQYKVLTDSWHEEYGENETQHSKRPRMVSILLDEKDPMFNKYRDNIREAQEKKQLEDANKPRQENTDENVVIETTPTLQEPPTPSSKTTAVKKKRTTKKKVEDASTTISTEETKIKPKRGRPKKQPDIMEAFSKSTTTPT